jgi:hypothetical protein
MRQEVWRTIPSLPQYQASSWGRVRCLPFIGIMPHGGEREYGGKPSYGTWRKDTKRYAILYRGQNYKVARLVCEAFKGPPPFNDARALHIDENSRNNRPTNLKWGTQQENLQALGFIEYCKNRTGMNNPLIKGILKKQPWRRKEMEQRFGV